MVLDASLLNAQQFKRLTKGKLRNPGKGVAPSPLPSDRQLEKREPSGRKLTYLLEVQRLTRRAAQSKNTVRLKGKFFRETLEIQKNN